MSMLPQVSPGGAPVAFGLRPILSIVSHRHIRSSICAASLMLVIVACDNPLTSPSASRAPKVAVPEAGPMSTQGPVAGPLSSSSPQAGAMSSGFPQMEQGSGNAASIASAGTFPNWTSNARVFGPRRGVLAADVVAPVMRLLWQNTSTGDRSIWLMNGASWDGSCCLQRSRLIGAEREVLPTASTRSGPENWITAVEC